MAFDFSVQGSLIAAIITILIASLFIYFAARMVLDRASLLAAIGTAVIGTFLATLAWGLLDGVWGMVLAIATWALVAALFFRTDWVKGAIIGVVAWLLWFLVSLAIEALV